MIRTLIVDDDPRIAANHATYVERVSGFSAVGVVHRGVEAWDYLARHEVDLVLLDLYLPDMTGLEVCRGLRAHGSLVDIIAITSARDLRVVRSMVAYGVVQYLIKPFTFAAFKDKLERYAEYRDQLSVRALDAAQQDVDKALAALRGNSTAGVPKGLSGGTLASVVDRLRQAGPGGLSAGQLGEVIGIARVTARRYLEHLADQGVVGRAQRYGTTGRPEHVYRWGRHA